MIYHIKQFLKDWIYPAYKLKNFFYYRYDIIKLQQIKRTEYSDAVERMLYANMKIIKDFIELEKPQKYVEWYGEYGHKYGQNKEERLYVPQYKDKYIMDIIKQIYYWWIIDLPNKRKEFEYIQDFWFQNVKGKAIFNKNKNEHELEFDTSKCPKKIEDIKNANWQILNKYFNAQDVLNQDIVFNKMLDLQKQIYLQKQKYLHLTIEVRSYLWT